MAAPGTQYILCLNGGSSSLKYALYRMDREDEALLAKGASEQIGQPTGRSWVRSGARAARIEWAEPAPDHTAAISGAFSALRELRLAGPTAVGHRVVHGGERYSEPARADPELLGELRRIVDFAPLHLPAQIAAMEAVARSFPVLPQVACFDTSFHRSMPELAQRFPIPNRFWEEGIKRYGFHGLSFEYVLSVLGASPGRRVIIAHLGSGASLAAIRDGVPLDTTMGLTPTGGMMMATRTGDLDPGALIYLMRNKGYGNEELELLVNRQSGMAGISGQAPDMRELLSERAHDPLAALAVDMFCYSAQKHIGAMAAALNGVDALVFTGGIGENAPAVRADICEGLTYLGLQLDPGKNAVNAGLISAPGSRLEVRVIPTNEDLVIARHVYRFLLRDSA